jgi:hypothetical protein
MIDIEQILVIGVASLVLVNFFAALALTIDWRRVAVHLRRFRKYWRVRLQQMSEEERQVNAMGAGLVVFFVWWTVAIVKGW